MLEKINKIIRGMYVIIGALVVVAVALAIVKLLLMLWGLIV